MAIIVVREKESSSSDGTYSQPYYVHQNPVAALTEAAAIAAVKADALADLRYQSDITNGINVYNAERISDHSFRIDVDFHSITNIVNPGSLPTPHPVGVVTAEWGLQFAAQSKLLFYDDHISTTRVPAGAPDLGGRLGIEVEEGQYKHKGLSIEAPTAVHSLTITIPNANVTATDIIKFEALKDTCNSASWAPFWRPTASPYAKGEVMVVSGSMSKRTDSDWQLTLGLSVRKNYSRTYNGDLYDIYGHDVVWGLTQETPSAILTQPWKTIKTKWLFRTMPWEFANFNTTLAFLL